MQPHGSTNFNKTQQNSTHTEHHRGTRCFSCSWCSPGGARENTQQASSELHRILRHPYASFLLTECAKDSQGTAVQASSLRKDEKAATCDIINHHIIDFVASNGDEEHREQSPSRDNELQAFIDTAMPQSTFPFADLENLLSFLNGRVAEGSSTFTDDDSVCSIDSLDLARNRMRHSLRIHRQTQPR